MQALRKQYSYFENLEKKIKSALAAYLVLFVIGTILTVLGLKNVFTFAEMHSALFAITAAVFVLFSFGGLMYAIGKVDWLGELHVKLDKQFFGFLERSNETIFRTLISVLSVSERKHFQNLPTEKKGTIAQTIFSQLSVDNNQLFTRLLKSGIFQNWIWYWISIYGTFSFTLLTLSSFAAVWRGFSLFSKPFFIVIWSMALTHLFVSIFLGKFLVNKTRKTVEGIVEGHEMDIANVLIARVHDQSTDETGEDLQYQESEA